MQSKGGIQMGRGGSSGGRALGSASRSIRAGVREVSPGRFRVPGLDRTFTNRAAATNVAETRRRQQRSAATGTL
jgi:hypothetical protein